MDSELAGFQRIAGTFVHDFNNLFQTALGNLDLLSGRLSDPSNTELLNESIISVERAIALTERLNLVGNKYPERFERLDVNSRIETTVADLRETLGPARKITFQRDATALYCRLPPGQLENALSALIVAGPAALSKGALAIEVAACDVADNADGLPAGAYVRITVTADNSDAPPPPEPASPLARLNLDLGVGLPLAQIFTAQLGGVCRLQQVGDRVTRVDLFLPGDVPGASVAPAESAVVTELAGGTALVADNKVLIVDDNPNIGDLLSHHLEGSGLEPVVVNDLASALTVFADGAGFRLLVCDIQLGAGGGGMELAGQARARKPALPIIFISGQIAQPDTSTGFSFENTFFLRKPFRSKQFKDAVHELLGPDAGNG